MLSYDIDLPPLTPLFLNISNGVYSISNNSQEGVKKFNYGLYVFSNTGKELRRLLIDSSMNDISEEYKKDFIDETEKKELVVQLVKYK